MIQFYSNSPQEINLYELFTFTKFKNQKINSLEKTFLQPGSEYIISYELENFYIWGPCGTDPQWKLTNVYGILNYNTGIKKNIMIRVTKDNQDEDICYPSPIIVYFKKNFNIAEEAVPGK